MSEKIRWAQKVRPEKIRRLYLDDAQGLVDEALLDDVGWALYLRCQSVLLVSNGQVKCPRCGCVFACAAGRWSERDDPRRCPRCGWETTPAAWHASWRHQDLNASRARSAFERFVDEYPQARTPAQRMLLVDALIHSFHRGIWEGAGHRAAANNLIEGSHRHVVALLDALAYGDASTPGVRETRAGWLAMTRRMWELRRGGPR